MIKLKNFAYVAGGWRVNKHVRLLADVNGDGRQEIVECGGRQRMWYWDEKMVR